MEEERKGIENISNALIPVERPGTAEQLKQFYNSEKWKEVEEGIGRMFEAVKESLKPIMEAVAEVVKDNYIKIMKIYTIDSEIKRCYGIYKRTKKRKNEKKANEQNKENNKKEIQRI